MGGEATRPERGRASVQSVEQGPTPERGRERLFAINSETGY